MSTEGNALTLNPRMTTSVFSVDALGIDEWLHILYMHLALTQCSFPFLFILLYQLSPLLPLFSLLPPSPPFSASSFPPLQRPLCSLPHPQLLIYVCSSIVFIIFTHFKMVLSSTHTGLAKSNANVVASLSFVRIPPLLR